MKSIIDNNVTNRTGVVYAKNEIKLSWPIELGTFYDENHVGQWRDRSYMCGLQWKWY